MKKTAVVTGATRGIGRCISTRLMEEGWVVFNLDRIEPQDTNGDTWIKVELADAADVDRALGDVLREGPVVGLVNNAAIAQMASLEQTTNESFDSTAIINTRAPMQCARALVPGMQTQRFGRVVNIASRAHLGKTLRTAYAASKGALVSMTKVWPMEYAGYGVTCNAIAPGPVRTQLFDQVNPPDHPGTREIIDTIPVGRMGEPEDIVNAVGFLWTKSRAI